MKIRYGFVSNSSTSSFICCITNSVAVAGHSSDYYDGADPASCVGGHEFCQEFILNDAVAETIEEKRDSLYFINMDYKLVEKMSDEEIEKSYIENTEKIKDKLNGGSNNYGNRINEIPRSFCPICQFKEIKRDRIFYYLLQERYGKGATTEDAKNEILNKFDGLKSFEEYLKI
jgi:hypothetical protein